MKKLGKIKILTLSALAAVAMAGSIALAQTAATGQKARPEGRGDWGQGQRWGHDGPGHGGLFRDLNLTDDQKTRLQQINQSFHESTKPLREQLNAKRKELRAASEGDTFNEALATQKLQDMVGLEAKLMGEHFKHRQAMLSILTPEQKTQLEQKRTEFKNRRGGPDGRRDQ
ncbi:MAG TPA: Spy/CpxP family protein refolding chaperone [Pyrinomonadaceae bacterium]|nr:Spy/CpxP family protein refolding chaperone [Pyrinomonadaceae bacterium]